MDKRAFYSNIRRCFFKDLGTAVAYQKANHPDSCRRIISYADNIALNRFTFDLPQDLEHNDQVLDFKDHIDWLAQIGDDPESVYSFNRMRYWISLGQAYALTGDEKYSTAFVSQARSWIREVPISVKKAWRTIEAGIRMENWMKAIAYFEASVFIDEEFLELFSSSIRTHAQYIMGIFNPFNLLSNWGVMSNHGLFVASSLMPTSDETLKWQSTAIQRLTEEIKIQVYDDGSHWEQSPMYHNEVLHHYLDVITISQDLGLLLPSALIKRVKAMARYSAAFQMPDGTCPTIGDSDAAAQEDLMVRSAILFDDSSIRSKAPLKPSFDCLWDIGSERALFFEKQIGRTADKALFLFPDSGNAYWQKRDTKLHFKAGTLGAGHGHADQLSFDIFYKSRPFLVDPGRFTYVDKPERYEFKVDKAHNAITIDDRNSYVPKDSWEYSKMSRAMFTHAKCKKGFCLLGASHLGYADQGVFVSRKLIILGPRLFVIADEAFSDREHTMQSHLHFHPSYDVKVDGDMLIARNDEATAYVKCFNSTSERLEDTRYSPCYNQALSNRSVTFSRSFEKTGTLLTVISLDRKPDIEKLEVRSTFKSIVFSDDLIEALRIDGMTVVISHHEWGSPTDCFEAGSCIGWGQVVVFGKNEKSTGTVLEY